VTSWHGAPSMFGEEEKKFCVAFDSRFEQTPDTTRAEKKPSNLSSVVVIS